MCLRKRCQNTRVGGSGGAQRLTFYIERRGIKKERTREGFSKNITSKNLVLAFRVEKFEVEREEGNSAAWDLQGKKRKFERPAYMRSDTQKVG